MCGVCLQARPHTRARTLTCPPPPQSLASALVDQLSGPDLKDSTALTTPAPATCAAAAAAAAVPGGARKLRVGVPRECRVEELGDEMRGAWGDALQGVREAGGCGDRACVRACAWS